MFKEFDKVIINSNGIPGIIVDISGRNGKTVYIVESDIKGPLDGGYGNEYPLFDCTKEDLLPG